jgi:uncharacterized SAM-binding protein YcdF (DUF218 family)
VLAVLALLATAWLVAGYFVVARPALDHPRRADAILVLGPPIADHRLETALALVNAHVSGNLVISLNSQYQRAAARVCNNGYRDVTVTCFGPDPATTRGEAQQLRRLAARHGWHSVVVVTSKYHISRARLIVSRCFDGQVWMVAGTGRIAMATWAYQYLYQTGAFIKAGLHRGC